MTRSYRLGIQIVVGAILLAAAVSLAWAARRASPRPACRAELPPGSFPLGDFRLIERSGRIITQSRFPRGVWVAGFIFTRCPLSCPAHFERDERPCRARFDRHECAAGEHFGRPRLRRAGGAFSVRGAVRALPDRWWFLTGRKEQINSLVQGRFKLGLQEASAADEAAGSEAITHSDRLALVDDGQVVGFFESSDRAVARRSGRTGEPAALPRLGQETCRRLTRA